MPIVAQMIILMTIQMIVAAPPMLNPNSQVLNDSKFATILSLIDASKCIYERSS